MFRGWRRYLKVLFVVAFLACVHNIYKATLGQYSRSFASSHEYFDSVAVRGDKLLPASTKAAPAKLVPDKAAVGKIVPDKTATGKIVPDKVDKESGWAPTKAWMRDLDTEIAGNRSQLMSPYVMELLKAPPTGCRTSNTSGGGSDKCLPAWQRHLKGITAKKNSGAPYFLTEVLQVRIYEDDKAKWSLAELKQWLHYMFLGGVEHVFICDHYSRETEILKPHLQRYIDLGLVTYYPWGELRHPMTAQIRCYQHIIDQFKDRCLWQLAVDMDEYPVSPVDMREGFLVRYLHNMTHRHGHALTEISMANYLMLGSGDRGRDVVIERINRMTPRAANILVKPVFRPQRVRANVHHNHLISGKPVNADPNELRMLHYWGARVQNWGPDTQRTRDITVEMNEMRNVWTPMVRHSLLAFGETDAFNSSSGP